ncbi:MAG TPA: choice-of-anchor D domain-containing protein [Casimicrobiaceae bacterium]|nr:choice-of-anchor D domain-containing protein [Casimicrobiaceae bacterium]
MIRPVLQTRHKLCRSARAFAIAIFASAVMADAHAAARICTSADTLLFGNREVGSSTSAVSQVSNCGDAPFTLVDVSTHDATSPEFGVVTTCATGVTLTPGQSCVATITFHPTVTGERSGALWLHNTTSTPDQLITFYGRGVDSRAGAAAIDFSPSPALFAATEVGSESALLVVLAHNIGTAPIVPSALVVNGPAAYDFRGEAHGAAGECRTGVSIPVGGTCHFNLYFRPKDVGTRRATLLIDAPELATLASLTLQGEGVVAAAASAIDVVEFHRGVDQYFLTAEPAEIAFLDDGGLGGDWVRTGKQFRAFPRGSTLPDAARDACRFFGTPGVGPDSHFYTVDAAECAQVSRDPHWTQEGVAFRAIPPIAGGCAAGYGIVVRLWKAGSDATGSRHRYATDAETIDVMARAGWMVEGSVFCVPL